MTVFTYNIADGNVSFEGLDHNDVLNITGGLDDKNFSFLRDDSDLIIYTGAGTTIRLTNHFEYGISSIETINIIGAGSIDMSYGNIIAVESESQNENVITEIFVPHLILGGTGDNALSGSLNNDIIYGGDGNDFLNGSHSDDKVYGGNGDDQVIGGAGADILHGGAGDDTIVGGLGFDIADYSGSTSAVSVNLGSGLASDGYGDTDTLFEIEGITGSDFNDTLFASNAIASTINGGAGNDNIQGRASDDILNGDAGSDNILGYAGNDTLNGGTGNDTLRGGNGDDVLYGGDHNDFLYGNNNNDTAYGGSGDDSINGGNGNDVLYGDTGSDILRGESGSDTLVGGAGLDFLRGGVDSSADIFKFTADEDSVDRIYEFNLAHDSIDITDLLTGYIHEHSDITDFVDIVHVGSRFDVRIDHNGGGDNFVSTARVLTNIDNNLTAQDLLDSGALIANGSMI